METSASSSTTPAEPVVQSEPAEEEMPQQPQQQDEAKELQQEIDAQMDPGETTATEVEASAEAAQTTEPEAVTWQPQGGGDALRWKKHPRCEPYTVGVLDSSGKRVITAKIRKKMLDKEIPYKEHPEKHLPLYHEAEDKEWQDWLKNKSVRIVKGAEAKKWRSQLDPLRIISAPYSSCRPPW